MTRIFSNPIKASSTLTYTPLKASMSSRGNGKVTEEQREQLRQEVMEWIVAHPEVQFGPVEESSTPDRPGIWIRVLDQWAYLGQTIESALFTARLSDWWIADRDGSLLPDDILWFEERARLGESWEQQELNMFQEERRIRRVLNIELATDDDPNRMESL